LSGLSGCINNFLLNGEHLPVDGATDRFIVTQRGRVAYDCPAVVATSTPSVTSSPAWKIPVIVICTIVGFILLIFLPALVVILYVRRDRKRDATKGKEDYRSNNIAYVDPAID
jgi:hypothetical protein